MIKRLWGLSTRWIRETTATLVRQAIVVFCVGTDVQLRRRVRYLAIAVAAYAFSPIDLIPDFIPVLGLIDDIIIVPAGVWLVLRLTPESVVLSAQQRANKLSKKPVYSMVGVIFILVWLMVGVMLSWAVLRWYSSP